MKSASMEKNYLPEFFLACLGYFLFVSQDAIVKYIAEDYQIAQIIFVNSWCALIPVILYTQTLNGWKKLKGANFKVHFFRSLTMALAVFFAYTGFYLMPMVTMYSIVFLTPLLITIGAVFLVICGLIPKIGAVIASMPLPVLGGGVIVMFGMVAAAGLNVLSEVTLNRRNMVIIAVSLAVGLGLNLVPSAVQYLPGIVKVLATSAVAPTALVAVILNLVLPEEE